MKQSKNLIESLFDFKPTLLKRNLSKLEDCFVMTSNFGDLIKSVKFETDDPKNPMTLQEILQSALNG
jgi:hypothetical protein